MMTEQLLCRVCGDGHVSSRVGTEQVEYQGHAGQVDVHTLVCAHCESEYAGQEEALLNKRAVIAFRKRIDGLLAGDEIRAIRRQYGINQGQAAAIFGGGPVAFSKYENDDVSHSASMDKLLRLASESGDAFRRLVLQAGLAEELPQQQPSAIVWCATTSVTNGASNDDAFLKGFRSPVEQGSRVRYELVGGY